MASHVRPFDDMSIPPSNDVIPNTAIRPIKKGEDEQLVDRIKFTERSAWLSHHIPLDDGTVVKIHEAYEMAFRHSIDDLEDKIEKAKNRALENGSDPIPVDDLNPQFNAPIGDEDIPAHYEDLLMDWFIQTFPR